MTAPVFTTAADLPAVEADAWRRIQAACLDRRSPFRTPIVSTAAPDGRPQSRIVVLREADAAAWMIAFHTDVRSAKVRDIDANPAISLLFWDPEDELQLRLEGDATGFSIRSDEGRAAFDAIPDPGRVKYRSSAAPEDVIGHADDVDFLPASNEMIDPAEANFLLVRVRIRTLDYLCLAGSRQRRAALRRGADGNTTRTWIVP